jgi:hypothetical protein
MPGVADDPEGQARNAASAVQRLRGRSLRARSSRRCIAVRNALWRSQSLRTRCRSLGVSPTAFIAHPPDLRPLMEMDFANACPLVRPALPRIRFLFVGSRLCSTLPSDGPSRFRPCAGLSPPNCRIQAGASRPRAATALTRPSRSAQRLPFGRQNVPTAKRITSVGRLGGLRPYRQGVCDAVPQGVEALRGLGADEARRAIGAGRDDIALLAQIVDVDLIRLGE